MSNRIVTRSASLLLAAFVFAGCSDDEPTGIDVLPFDVTPVSNAIDHGATADVTLTGTTNAEVDWVTDNAAIATVTPTGSAGATVTGVSPGTTAISAVRKSDGFVVSTTIQVIALQGTAVQRGVATTVIHSGTRGTGTFYRLFVPAGRTSLTVTLTGGTGDADIYVRRQTPPPNTIGTSVANQTCASFNAANEESCVIANPVSGTWYVRVDVWDPGTGAQLTMNYAP